MKLHNTSVNEASVQINLHELVGSEFKEVRLCIWEDNFCHEYSVTLEGHAPSLKYVRTWNSVTSEFSVMAIRDGVRLQD